MAGIFENISAPFVSVPSTSPKHSLRLETRLTNALTACILFDIFDDAIADLLCLRTYAHGTSPKCYHNIMKVGLILIVGVKGEKLFFIKQLARSLTKRMQQN